MTIIEVGTQKKLQSLQHRTTNSPTTIIRQKKKRQATHTWNNGWCISIFGRQKRFLFPQRHCVSFVLCLGSGLNVAMIVGRERGGQLAYCCDILRVSMLRVRMCYWRSVVRVQIKITKTNNKRRRKRVQIGPDVTLLLHLNMRRLYPHAGQFLHGTNRLLEPYKKKKKKSKISLQKHVTDEYERSSWIFQHNNCQWSARASTKQINKWKLVSEFVPYHSNSRLVIEIRDDTD